MATSFSPDILVSDVEKSLRFLTEALGFKEVSRMAPEGGAPVWAALERDGHRVMIENHASPDPETRGMIERAGGRLAATVHFYLSVDSLEAEVRRLRTAGVAYEGPTLKPYGMRELAFKDPDGYSWMVGERVES